MKRHSLWPGLLMPVFLILSCAAYSHAQEDPSEAALIESLEFREVDIKDVLRQLAKQFGLNIVFSEKVSGLVTVQLTGVTVDEALDSIVTVNGFVYTKKGAVIKITTPEEAEREGKQTRLFKLNNADALKLKDTLKKVLTSDGSIEADTRSNSLVVTDTLSVVNKIEGMIPGLDEITPQVLIEAKLIETSLTTSEKLGIDWTTTISATGSSRKTTLPFRPKGEDWMRNIFPQPISTSADFPAASPFGFPFTVKGDFTFGTLDFTTLRAVFDMLRERNDTKLVANPRVVTLNNQKAKINVGRRIPLPIYTIDEATGRITVTDWEYLDVGVNLEVTPQVSPDEHIKLRLKPEVSSLTGEFIGPEDNQRPIYSTRIAETEVQVRDGQTVVIGGLVKNRTANITKKIPILGDIPILGFLFTQKKFGTEEDPEEKTDLLIFVTARIIRDTDQALIALEKGIVTSPPRAFKMETREIK